MGGAYKKPVKNRNARAAIRELLQYHRYKLANLERESNEYARSAAASHRQWIKDLKAMLPEETP